MSTRASGAGALAEVLRRSGAYRDPDTAPFPCRHMAQQNKRLQPHFALSPRTGSILRPTHTARKKTFDSPRGFPVALNQMQSHRHHGHHHHHGTPMPADCHGLKLNGQRDRRESPKPAGDQRQRAFSVAHNLKPEGKKRGTRSTLKKWTASCPASCRMPAPAKC